MVPPPLRHGDYAPPSCAIPFASPLWRNPAFVRVWSRATISIFGSLITRIALPLVAILVLGSGALEVAILRGLDLGATLVFGLVAGAWVDRLRRRPVLIWADLGRAVLLGSVPVAFALGVLGFPQLLVVSGLAAILTTFFDAADNAYLPTIVERDRLVDANSALAASGSAAEFMAFGISGFLVQLLTAPIAIAIDALSFLVSALLLGTIRRRGGRRRPSRGSRAGAGRDPGGSRPRPSRPGPAGVRRGADGARRAVGHLRGDLVPVRARRARARARPSLGVVAGVGGASSFIGAVVATRATRRWGIGTVAIGAMLLAALGNAFIPLAPAGLPLVAIGCLVMQQLVADSAVTVYDITEVSVRQTLVHDRALGRVSSTFTVAAMVAQLVATLAAGRPGRGRSGCARRRGWRRSAGCWRGRDPVGVAGPPASSACRRRRRAWSRWTQSPWRSRSRWTAARGVRLEP